MANASLNPFSYQPDVEGCNPDISSRKAAEQIFLEGPYGWPNTEPHIEKYIDGRIFRKETN